MTVIGLTGSLAAGKSTVAEIFRSLGYPVFDSDCEAKKLYSKEEIYTKTSDLVGKSIVTNGSVDYDMIANYIFLSESNNKKIRDILYPYLCEVFNEWKRNRSEEIVIIEAAMLFEGNCDNLCDITINVSASYSTRIERLSERNKNNVANFLKRNKFQYSNSKKNSLSDFIIYNDVDKELLPQVLYVIDEIKYNYKDRIVGTKIIFNGNICEIDNYHAPKRFLYEVIRLTDSQPEFAKEHYDRLTSSNNGIKINSNYNTFMANIKTLSAINNITNCNVKVVFDGCDEYYFFIKSHYPSLKEYQKGAKVVTANISRISPNIKQFNKLFRLKSNLLIHKSNVNEILLVDTDGNITEGSRSNVFFVGYDNVIYTAPDEYVLKGITRLKVIEYLRSKGYVVEYKLVNTQHLSSFRAAFLTGTSIRIYNICSINGRKLEMLFL